MCEIILKFLAYRYENIHCGYLKGFDNALLISPTFNETAIPLKISTR